MPKIRVEEAIVWPLKEELGFLPEKLEASLQFYDCFCRFPTKMYHLINSSSQYLGARLLLQNFCCWQ